MPTPTTTAAPVTRPARSMAGRLARVLLGAGLVAALAGGLTFGAAVLNGPSGPPPASDAVPAAAFEQLSSASLAAGIGQLQQHLRAQPRDATGWATLGLSYVEQARLTADPAYYPKAAASAASPACAESLSAGRTRSASASAAAAFG